MKTTKTEGVIATKTWHCDDGNCEVEIVAKSARDAAQEYVDDGDWGEIAETTWISVHVWRTESRAVACATCDQMATSHDEDGDPACATHAMGDAATMVAALAAIGVRVTASVDPVSGHSTWTCVGYGDDHDTSDAIDAALPRGWESSWMPDGRDLWIERATPNLRPLVETECVDEETVRIEITPQEPECESDGQHDWCEDDDGVRGHGGGVIIRDTCSRCGLHRRTDTWATDTSTGEQGLTSVRYDRDDD